MEIAMIPKKLESGGGRDKSVTFDKLTIDLNHQQFSLVQQAESVRLRLFCGNDDATMVAKNMGSAAKRRGEVACLSLHLDYKTFLSTLNPELKIIFRAGNVLAPYVATALFKEALFGGKEPLHEPDAMKN